MKILFSLLMLMGAAFTSRAQLSLPPLDKSPLDISYYPVNYPSLKVQHKGDGPLVARAIYGRPQKNNRVIFGDLVPYNTIWRLGANEATEIEFYKDVKIADKKILKGRYTLYAIPATDKWTMVLNKETDTWGAYDYDPKKDVLRTDIPIHMQTDTTESFTMIFNKVSDNSASLVITWDTLQVMLPFNW